jgi:hypothetical protein
MLMDYKSPQPNNCCQWKGCEVGIVAAYDKFKEYCPQHLQVVNGLLMDFIADKNNVKKLIDVWLVNLGGREKMMEAIGLDKLAKEGVDDVISMLRVDMDKRIDWILKTVKGGRV